MSFLTSCIVSTFLVVLALSQSNKNYEYWCVGNCNKDVNTTTYPGLVLMGGGTDVDDAFIQHIKWSGDGDFLVIRQTGDDAYNKYIYRLGRSNSVATLLLKNRQAAYDSFVLKKIAQAEAIFFAGGNQAAYLANWGGTPMQTAVQRAIDADVPIGGTSAGCDIQSFYVYSAKEGSVTSSEALLNPYNFRVTLANFFITQKYNLLNNTVVDTHFVTRDRFGRLMAFVARLMTDSPSAGRPIKGIGIDEHTAILIDQKTEKGRMVGSSTAYILKPDYSRNDIVCRKDVPLTLRRVNTQKLDAYYRDTYDFRRWSGGASSDNYDVSCVVGDVTSDPY